MKPTTPLESIGDAFVKGIGGDLISELVGNNNPPSSADYLCWSEHLESEPRQWVAGIYCYHLGGESWRIPSIEHHHIQWHHCRSINLGAIFDRCASACRNDDGSSLSNGRRGS